MRARMLGILIAAVAPAVLCLTALAGEAAAPQSGAPGEFEARPAENKRDSIFLVSWSKSKKLREQQKDNGYLATVSWWLSARYLYTVKIASIEDGHYRVAARVPASAKGTFGGVDASLPYRLKPPDGYFTYVDRRKTIHPYWLRVETNYSVADDTHSIKRCQAVLNDVRTQIERLGDAIDEYEDYRASAEHWLPILEERLEKRKAAVEDIIESARAGADLSGDVSVVELYGAAAKRIGEAELKRDEWRNRTERLMSLAGAEEAITETRAALPGAANRPPEQLCALAFQKWVQAREEDERRTWRARYHALKPVADARLFLEKTRALLQAEPEASPGGLLKAAEEEAAEWRSRAEEVKATWQLRVKALKPLAELAQRIGKIKAHREQLEEQIGPAVGRCLDNLVSFQSSTRNLAAETVALFQVHGNVDYETLTDSRAMQVLQRDWAAALAELESRERRKMTPADFREKDRLRFLTRASEQFGMIDAVRGDLAALEEEVVLRLAVECRRLGLEAEELVPPLPKGQEPQARPASFEELIPLYAGIHEIEQQSDKRAVSAELGEPRSRLEQHLNANRRRLQERLYRGLRDALTGEATGPVELEKLTRALSRMKFLLRPLNDRIDKIRLDFDHRTYWFKLATQGKPAGAEAVRALAERIGELAPRGPLLLILAGGASAALNLIARDVEQVEELLRLEAGPVSATGRADWFNGAYLFNFIFAVFFTGSLLLMVWLAKHIGGLYIRKIAGLDAVDEAIGRATEMGQPALFVHGLTGVGDVAVLASLNILGRVAKQVATYDSRVLVANNNPIVYSISQEVVREGFTAAGRPDLYNRDDIFMCASEQFPFTAAVAGIMAREKPAANFFMGYFYAEALILAEVGAESGAIQICGTDAFTQLPFFITTCDYTLIGEELYAASAYLSREPKLLGTLKAQDWAKALIALLVLSGVVLSFVIPKWNVIELILKIYD